MNNNYAPNGLVPQARQESCAGRGGSEFQMASRSEAVIAYSRRQDTRYEQTKKKNNITGTLPVMLGSPAHRRVQSLQMARNRNLCRVVYPTRSVREWKFSSEFGVPRGRGVARSRTPVAVTEARTQYLAILSQPPQEGGYGSPAQTILRASAAGVASPSHIG